MNAALNSARPEIVEGQAQTTYLVDNHSNLHIQAGDQRLVITPAGALELLKFLERTQFQQNVKGAAQ